MPTKVIIPTALRQFTGNKAEVDVDGKDVGEIMQKLARQFPQLGKNIYKEDGQLRNFVNIYVNEDDVRHLDSHATALKQGDVISIVPSIAGGRALPRSERANEDFTLDEIERYSRHLIIPEIALEGQKKLKQAKVLIVGLGGLGSPLGMYLAAAGVGRLGLLDFDVVDYTNLQRQVIHSTRDVGRPKLESARERIEEINPHVDIDTYETLLSSENALDILDKYDIVVDGTDNFPTRYLVNDACVLLGKPNVYGSIFRFEGQASVFYAKEGPCYRCLYPEPPPPGLVPSCAEGGVLGVLPGIVGLIQATEIIKLITGTGEPLIGRLLLFDALAMKFRELKTKKNPDCPICGENPSIHQLIDYEEFCGIGTEQERIRLDPELELSASELREAVDLSPGPFLLDVREPHEYEICRLPHSRLIPLGQLPTRIHELDRQWEIVAYCRSGVRSAEAVKFLRESGFDKIKNLRGGILAWADQVDPTMPRY